jgi:hypothetical protein
VTWTAYYANTTNTFGTLASPTRTQIATGTFTVTSTLTQYSTQISLPSAANTGVEIVFTVGAQTSGTWTIGNVQLEKGSVATAFDVRSIGTELGLCQRYCPVIDGSTGYLELPGYMSNSTGGNVIYFYPVTPRALPTGITVTGTYVASSSVATSATLAFQSANFGSAGITVTTSGQVANCGMIIQGTSAKIIFNGCEL